EAKTAWPRRGSPAWFMAACRRRFGSALGARLSPGFDLARRGLGELAVSDFWLLPCGCWPQAFFPSSRGRSQLLIRQEANSSHRRIAAFPHPLPDWPQRLQLSEPWPQAWANNPPYSDRPFE